MANELTRNEPTADEPTARRSPYADIAPALGDYTDNVLFGEVWERPGLSKATAAL
jgi:4-carboxymuconolactone decarboxylase